jgi:predicted phage terminase large subunit-like protein
MVPHEWNALYMQTPTAEEGTIVKRYDFKIWHEDKPPPCFSIVVSLDTAFSTKETADYSAYTVWGVFQYFDKDFQGNDVQQKGIVLLDAGKARYEFAELCNKAQEIFNQYTPDYMIIENKASGQSLIQELSRRALPIVPYSPEKDKVFRLHACTPFFKQGRVWVPEGKSWADEVIEEVISFPFAPHDDLTDTVSQAILWFRDSYHIDNDGYPYYDEEEEAWAKKRRMQKGGTYWSSLTSEF